MALQYVVLGVLVVFPIQPVLFKNDTNKPPFHFGRTIKKDTSPSLYRYQREGDVLFVKLAGLSKAVFCQQARKEDSIRD